MNDDSGDTTIGLLSTAPQEVHGTTTTTKRKRGRSDPQHEGALFPRARVGEVGFRTRLLNLGGGGKEGAAGDPRTAERTRHEGSDPRRRAGDDGPQHEGALFPRARVEGLDFELGCERTQRGAAGDPRNDSTKGPALDGVLEKNERNGTRRADALTTCKQYEGTGPRRRTDGNGAGFRTRPCAGGRGRRSRGTSDTIRSKRYERQTIRQTIRYDKRYDKRNGTTNKRTNERNENERDDDRCTLLLLATIRAVDLAVTYTPATKAGSTAKTILELLRGEVGYTRH
jgi:hypothetical protein